MGAYQTSNQDVLGNLGVAAAVTTSAPTYTTGTTAALSLTLNGLLRVDGSGVTQPISAAALPLPTGAATAALQTTGNTTLSAISGQLPATLGQKTMANSLAVVLASDQSVISITGNIGVAQSSTTAAEIGPLVQGAVTTAAPTYTTATTNPLSLTVAGALRVDGSAVTQPISAVALPLPAGAATAALQTTGNTTLAAISAQLPTTLGQKVSASSLSVVISSDQSPIPVTASLSSTAVITSVTNSLTSQVALASNSARRGFIIFNDSLAVVFVAFAATASTTAFSVKLQQGAEYEPGIDYTGVISVIASAAIGACRITEFT